MEYDVAREYSLDELKKRINWFISQGWTPIGGIFIESANDSDEKVTRYYQSVLKSK